MESIFPVRALTMGRDLSRRAMYGGLVYLGFIVALVVATDYAQARPVLIWLVAACAVICAAGRWLLAVRFDQIHGYSSRLWKLLLWTAVVLTAGVWGVFLAATVGWFGYYDTKTLILLVCLAGTAPIAVTSFAPSLRLTLAYEFVICTPMIVVNIHIGGLTYYTFAALFSWYLVFMVIVARRLHMEYRESLGRGEMQLARHAAEEANRAKSDLLAYISHEIRGPMNAIGGMTYLALDAARDREQRKYLEIVHDSSRFLVRLLNELLDVSRIDANGRELECLPLDLHSLVEGVAAAYRAEAECKGVSFQTEIATDVPRFITGDARVLRQVLENIVANAVRFTEKGRVEIAVSAEEPDEASVVIRFSVADTGVGIPPSRQRAIFEPFQQADASISRRHGGTGLGLAICSRLVRLMGGAISVESQPGAGSTFRWTARLQRSESPKPELSVEPVVPVTEGHGVRILVAEDDAVSQLVTRRLLERHGYVVQTASNGYEVLDALDRERFELVLMDLQMPELGGLETASMIRRKEAGSGRALPIIALTARTRNGTREECLNAGMNDYLSKPIDPAQLYRLVEQHAVGREA